MNKPLVNTSAPDQAERQRALDSAQSILVQAPAGSGKTDLLTRRFLLLLGEVEEPGQVVAITFTIAAAAEMRHRILAELEKAAANPEPASDTFSMAALAQRALVRSEARGWKLLDLPSQLRISTIDSFCRELALQQPLLSGLGGGLEIAEQPRELYRRAARETLRKIDDSGSVLSSAIESLLLWRDNGWHEMEELLIEMLANRDRWMRGFVLEREPAWQALRERLERPFANVVRDALAEVSQLLDRVPGAREEALQLARFACEEAGANSPWSLAECAEIPSTPFTDGIEYAREVFSLLAGFLQTLKGEWRSQKGLKTADGFPSTTRGRAGKASFSSLIAQLAAVPGLETALCAVRDLPPARYTENDWQVVRSCFTLLRHAAGELQIAFAEAGRVDFVEVAQIAQHVLQGVDGLPTDAALVVSDGIRHLLVDEFQDTSRRQHQLLASLIAAWPERPGRTCFAVGDPMQSIYFFRDADAELFQRVKTVGLEVSHDEPLPFAFVPLTANFRTRPALVAELNQAFAAIFAINDGSGIAFSAAEPAREETACVTPAFSLHLEFVPQAGDASEEKDAARKAQIEEIVALVGNQMSRVEAARSSGEKFRIAVLGRARTHLIPIAEALRKARIPFRAVELEKLAERPEVLDALALARALLQPENRVAWLGVLRAPWCGLSLADLHAIAGTPELLKRPVPELLAARQSLLSEAGRPAAARVLDALAMSRNLRAAEPTAALGSWLERVWFRIGGAACVDETARANLNLLWSCLDRLAEEDLLGSALDAALDKLTALPDATSTNDCGVQLMTIHKSKGLEFEIVIVPELQARGGRGAYKMLSWLERGLAEPDDSGEITEFLIAPFQRKGEERGNAKAWVDHIYSEREAQETRRILYVAATRAREELHLFARPAYRQTEEDFALIEPTNCLLATAWPAFEQEIRTRFDEWKATRIETAVEGEGLAIAASGESNLIMMPAPVRTTLLRRLPPEFCGPNNESPTDNQAETGLSSLYSRHEGGQLSRALGTAVHSLLEEFARLRETLDADAARAALDRFIPRTAAHARATGLNPIQSGELAAEAMKIAFAASRDSVGEWIFSPQIHAQSEAAWTGVVNGGLRTVRVDRVFQAGAVPCDNGDDSWWVIDYKTAHDGNLDPAVAIPAFRRLFAPQVEAYAAMLRNLHGGDRSIRAGLYYPRMLQFDWWEF
jgi:ATP-dependent exoDNAse (exonuclease V) beta subunit